MTARGPVEIRVSFGPTTSANGARALAIAARFGAGGRAAGARTTILTSIDVDRAPYPFLYELLGLVKGWRSTAIEIAGEPEPAYVVQSMLHCARGWIRSKSTCGERYYNEVWAKCWVCPLFEEERAHREVAEYAREDGRTNVIDVPGGKVILGDPVSAEGFTERTIALYRKRRRTAP